MEEFNDEEVVAVDIEAHSVLKICSSCHKMVFDIILICLCVCYDAMLQCIYQQLKCKITNFIGIYGMTNVKNEASSPFASGRMPLTYVL